MKPRGYQITAVNHILNYLSDNPGKHPVVAMPTGSGKSLVIAEVVKHVVKTWGAKVLILSHVKEILVQDRTAMINHIGGPVGLYSVGLGSKTIERTTVAGIQSIWRKPDLFKQFDLIIIDEAHLINPDENSMYRKFFDEVKSTYLGLTATPFRLGDGYIYGKDCLFDDMVYDLTSMSNFNKLVADGYLCRLRVPQTQLELDVHGVHTKMGDFVESEMADKFNNAAITESALNEVQKLGGECKKWLIFAINIDHAENITQSLKTRGIAAEVIHSKLEIDRGVILQKFKEGSVKCIVNVNVLTTGFDDPEIDLIVMLRPTQSPVLYVQSVGRGLRIAPGKKDCLIMDFAGNTKRLGCINDIQVRKKKKGVEGIKPITKTCPECAEIMHPLIRICESCGFKFTFKENDQKIDRRASNYDIVAEEARWFDIENIEYSIIRKGVRPPMILVEYHLTNLKTIDSYWCLENKGYARTIARRTIKSRCNEVTDENLSNCEAAMKIVGALELPTKIRVKLKGKYPEILKYSF